MPQYLIRCGTASHTEKRVIVRCLCQVGGSNAIELLFLLSSNGDIDDGLLYTIGIATQYGVETIFIMDGISTMPVIFFFKHVEGA
ncbi:hypothetical protein D3H65_09850 [Paraflavitalea soli]|uniref:Uncharacterized protein n=1 Tax=Paraflavitalea soli TaxID=2315862 RepID=A0A3B7MJ92_9BACT|nr:hypothetical protein D3H65_09850 [Paraflavitalea soli]